MLVPADKWDGKTLTFTNVQQNGTEYVLYIDDSNVLSIATESADAVGEAAQFNCKKEASGKYSFFNEKAQLYMIWRAGGNYGYNNNAGTLDTYNATYCDWSINDAAMSRIHIILSANAVTVRQTVLSSLWLPVHSTLGATARVIAVTTVTSSALMLLTARQASAR